MEPQGTSRNYIYDTFFALYCLIGLVIAYPLAAVTPTGVVASGQAVWIPAALVTVSFFVGLYCLLGLCADERVIGLITNLSDMTSRRIRRIRRGFYLPAFLGTLIIAPGAARILGGEQTDWMAYLIAFGVLALLLNGLTYYTFNSMQDRWASLPADVGDIGSSTGFDPGFNPLGSFDGEFAPGPTQFADDLSWADEIPTSKRGGGNVKIDIGIDGLTNTFYLAGLSLFPAVLCIFSGLVYAGILKGYGILAAIVLAALCALVNLGQKSLLLGSNAESDRFKLLLTLGTPAAAAFFTWV